MRPSSGSVRRSGSRQSAGSDAIRGSVAPIPTPAEELRPRARRLARKLAEFPGIAAEAVPCASQAGSGALPAREIASWGVRVTLQSRSAQDLAADLRTGDPAILARVHEDAVLLDLRTLSDEEVERVVGRVGELAKA